MSLISYSQADQIIQDFGWEISEYSFEDCYAIYVPIGRDDYELALSNWDTESDGRIDFVDVSSGRRPVMDWENLSLADAPLDEVLPAFLEDMQARYLD